MNCNAFANSLILERMQEIQKESLDERSGFDFSLRKELEQHDLRVPSLSVSCVLLLPVCFTLNFPFYFCQFYSETASWTGTVCPQFPSTLRGGGCNKSQIDIACFLWFSLLLFKRFIDSFERPWFRRDDPQQTRSTRNPVWFIFFRIGSFPLSKKCVF